MENIDVTEGQLVHLKNGLAEFQVTLAPIPHIPQIQGLFPTKISTVVDVKHSTVQSGHNLHIVFKIILIYKFFMAVTPPFLKGHTCTLHEPLMICQQVGPSMAEVPLYHSTIVVAIYFTVHNLVCEKTPRTDCWCRINNFLGLYPLFTAHKRLPPSSGYNCFCWFISHCDKKRAFSISYNEVSLN